MDAAQAYTPVACAFHERLEFAVLRRLVLELSWTDESGGHADRVLPLDVATHEGAEWLTFRGKDGNVKVVRLDHISAMTEVRPADPPGALPHMLPSA